MLFEVTDLYAPNYAATLPVVVNQGGTGSSKTYTILQVLFTLLSQGAGLVATVAGQDIPNLKVGALRDAEMIVESSPALQTLLKEYSKSERIYRFHNGSLLEFKSYDDPQDAKSGKRDYLFMNEANGVPYPVYQELYLRTRIRTFIDYNPNAEFWVHEKLIGKPHVAFLRSWHIHNQFLPDRMRATIEALKEQDRELWRVYARGLTGKIEGLVLRDVFNAEMLPEGAKYLGTGLDFGFTNDPTACYDVHQAGGELYIDELLYTTGLTNPDIYAALANVRPARQFAVVADSAEPKSIEELRRLGLPIEPAAKGPDSINAGIGTMKAYRINLLPSCVHLKKEVSNYKWKVDRLTGKATNTPVDAFNHGIDAVRYLITARLQAPPLIAARATARSWKKPVRALGRDFGG